MGHSLRRGRKSWGVLSASPQSPPRVGSVPPFNWKPPQVATNLGWERGFATPATRDTYIFNEDNLCESAGQNHVKILRYFAILCKNDALSPRLQGNGGNQVSRIQIETIMNFEAASKWITNNFAADWAQYFEAGIAPMNNILRKHMKWNTMKTQFAYLTRLCESMWITYLLPSAFDLGHAFLIVLRHTLSKRSQSKQPTNFPRNRPMLPPPLRERGARKTWTSYSNCDGQKRPKKFSQEKKKENALCWGFEMRYRKISHNDSYFPLFGLEAPKRWKLIPNIFE